MASIVCVVPAGDPNTTFWPMSRLRKPAYLMKISDQESLLRRTCSLLTQLAENSPVIIVAPEPYESLISPELGDIEHITLTEPANRGSFHSLGTALASIDYNPHTTVVYVPSNLWIADSEGLKVALGQALELAQELPVFVTLGSRLTYPEQDYHYLKVHEKQFVAGRSALAATDYLPRPGRALAARLLESTDHLACSGILVFRLSVWARYLKKRMPDTAKSLESLRLAFNTGFFSRVQASEYATWSAKEIWSTVIESTTCDKKKGLAVIPTSAAWSLLTGWSSLTRLAEADGNGNVCHGAAILDACRECLFESQGPLLVSIGLSNITVVATPDVILVCDNSHREGTGAVLSQLRSNGMQRYL